VRTLEVARGEVIECKTAFTQVARRKLALDQPLAFEQPIHRRIHIIRIGRAHTELLGERRRVPPAGGGKLRVRRKDSRGDEREDALALPAFRIDHQRIAKVICVKIALNAPLCIEQKGIHAVIRGKIAHVVSDHAVQPANPVAARNRDLGATAEVEEAATR